MYVRIEGVPSYAIARHSAAMATEPGLLRPSGRICAGLGQPGTSIPACISMPQWITPSKHFFSPKAPVLRNNKFEWQSTGADIELSPNKLNPGFIYPVNHGLALDTNLNAKLKALIAKVLAHKAPFDRAPYRSFKAHKGKIGVALVDLSTDFNLAFPEIAEFNSTAMTHGGSLTKIGLLYAALQRRFDLNVQARTDPASMTDKRIQLVRHARADVYRHPYPGGTSGQKPIFDVTRGGHPPVLSFDFSGDFRRELDGICDNCSASRISTSLGLSFINSALWQSGLYHCRWGGIWLGLHYNAWNPTKKKWDCDKDPYNFKDICTKEDGCHNDPKGGKRLAVNALSVAAFFTLLAQGRLIDDRSSQTLKDILIQQPDECGSQFKDGLKAAGRLASVDRIYSKIGVTDAVSHEGALIDRVSIGKKYVAVVLTESGGGRAERPTRALVRRELIVELDELIKTKTTVP